MASLVLSDGTTFEGESFGASLDSVFPSAEATGDRRDDTFGEGEVVFNTGMAGYPESLTS